MLEKKKSMENLHSEHFSLLARKPQYVALNPRISNMGPKITHWAISYLLV